MKISYCLTVCNELHEIISLFDFLTNNIRETDEILIQYDSEKVTDEVLDFLKIQEKLHDTTKIIGFPLKGDFGGFKNNLKQNVTGDYIFQIDADEIPHKHLIHNLPDVLESNPVDLIFVPRINTVDGITNRHVNNWGWQVGKLDTQIGEKVIEEFGEEYRLLKQYDLIIKEEFDGWSETVVNEKLVKVRYHLPIINPFEYQTRIYKVTPDIHWQNKVHELINGYDTFSNFPAEEKWSLYHHKTIQKQEIQNKFYDNIQ